MNHLPLFTQGSSLLGCLVKQRALVPAMILGTVFLLLALAWPAKAVGSAALLRTFTPTDPYAS